MQQRRRKNEKDTFSKANEAIVYYFMNARKQPLSLTRTLPWRPGASYLVLVELVNVDYGSSRLRVHGFTIGYFWGAAGCVVETRVYTQGTVPMDSHRWGSITRTESNCRVLIITRTHIRLYDIIAECDKVKRQAMVPSYQVVPVSELASKSSCRILHDREERPR